MACCNGYGEHLGKYFPKTDAVKADRDRLGQKEDDPNGSSELKPQCSGDQIVVAAPLDLDIGSNSRKGDCC